LGFRPVGQKILEDHLPLSPLERGTAFSARYLAIKCLRIGFGPNELIFCAALRTAKGDDTLFDMGRIIMRVSKFAQRKIQIRPEASELGQNLRLRPPTKAAYL
jgi:hypothetical protein